jgi:uncharacterized protein
VYAPHGLADVFNLTVRPNPVLAPRHVYQAKAARWQQQWPSLDVLRWPANPATPRPHEADRRTCQGPAA